MRALASWDAPIALDNTWRLYELALNIQKQDTEARAARPAPQNLLFVL